MPDDLLTWLTTRAWPLWLEYGVDRKAGAFNESLTLKEYRSTASFRRLRVLTRQIYVFSKAAEHGLAGAADTVEMGLTFLLGRARHPDGGYAWRFDLDGNVIDDRRDLYDHAFALLALASSNKLLPSHNCHEEARSLSEFISTRLRHQQAGFVESLPASLPRRQNPHMHLLEAYLTAAESFGDALFLDRASELIDLFAEHLLDKKTGTLPEYFSDALLVETTENRHVWEPGHHCEWIWLLSWYERLTGPSHRLENAQDLLWHSVKNHGAIDDDPTLIDEVWSNGDVKKGTARLWPQTERLKSSLAIRHKSPGERARAEAVLKSWLRPDGTWHERRDAEGHLTMEPIPASSLYHLTCGILFKAS